MAFPTRLLANAIFLLSVVTACCREIGQGLYSGRRRNYAERLFNVLQFGARHDPGKDNALAFVRAWKATCRWKGKARLIIPGGEFLASSMVFQGPCENPAPVVEIRATMKALSDLSNYAQDVWISFENINGLTITGTGTVDGQGQNVWKYNDAKGSVFPANIKLFDVTNGFISRINSVNPMGFHIGIVLSRNIRVRNLHLHAPENSPNTDGFHISQSSRVKIATTDISTGDDCIGIIQGSTNIKIDEVSCGPGHGISIGSLGKYPDEKDVEGIIVTNCTLKNTENGVRIKTWGGSPPSRATSLTFKDIIMDNVTHPIIIDQSYGSKSGSPSRVKISNVKYINIRGTTNSEVGVDLQCSKQVPCEGVRLSNINLKYIGDKRLPFSSSCQNAGVTYAGMQFPPPCR